MIKGDSSRVYYFNAGINRKKQIYNWVNEVLDQSGRSFNNVFIELTNGNFNGAYEEFKIIIRFAMGQEQTLGYILQENMDKFGERRILDDLYRNLIINKFKRKRIKIPTRTKKVTVTDIKQFEKDKTEKFARFGIDAEGNKRKATLKAVLINNKIQYRVIDLKTKKFLKPSEATKIEIGKLKDEKK